MVTMLFFGLFLLALTIVFMDDRDYVYEAKDLLEDSIKEEVLIFKREKMDKMVDDIVEFMDKPFYQFNGTGTVVRTFSPYKYDGKIDKHKCVYVKRDISKCMTYFEVTIYWGETTVYMEEVTYKECSSLIRDVIYKEEFGKNKEDK